MTQEREREDAQLAQLERKNEEKREREWHRTGRGKGNRWLMLRDLLSILALRPMSINLVQDTMFLHRGLKRTTVREMLDQLERTHSIEQIEDASEFINRYVWRATDGGVHFWISSRKAIPAHIARVAWTMQPVKKSEVSE